MAFNILIADDSSTVRSIVARTLVMAGVPAAQVFGAKDGSDALAVLKREWIDLVFLDINMPVTDGIAVMEAMAEDEILKTVPVVVISSDVSPAKVSRLRKAGARAFVNKPFTPETIRDVVESILGGWEHDGGPRPDNV